MPNDDLAYPNHESLLPWQPDNIRNVLKLWRDGSLTGHGNAKGPLLGLPRGWASAPFRSLLPARLDLSVFW